MRRTRRNFSTPPTRSLTTFVDLYLLEGLSFSPMATNDLSSILTSSRALNAHLQTRPDLPTVNLGLDQVELQSRRLVNRYAGASYADTGRA
jgi:hypothetical protein